MRVALLAPGYPSDAVPYRYAFLHARAKRYQQAGHDVHAFCIGDPLCWQVDGVSVRRGEGAGLAARVGEWRPDVLAVHAPQFRVIDVAQQVDSPQVCWIHGSEAQFNLWGTDGASVGARLLKRAKLVPRNLYQLARLRAFLPSQHAVVFVSRWLRDRAGAHLFTSTEQMEVLPNPVDTSLFSYRLDPGRRLHGVSTRSMRSAVYGLDVAVDAFARPGVADLTLHGEGYLAAGLKRRARRKNSRTTLIPEQVAHRDMPELLGRYGFFVAPSRSETQGVAMCEAMACGLPVVATHVGGIPEFVTHGEGGLLVPPDDPEALARAIEELTRDEARYLEMSRMARSGIEARCAADRVVPQELYLLARATGDLVSRPDAG